MVKVGFKRYANIDEKYKAFIDENKLSAESKKILWEWAKDRRANKFRDKNNLGLLGTIRDIGLAVKKDLDKIEKADLQRFFSNTELSPTTELWYKKALKRFYAWLCKSRDDPALFRAVAWIDTKELSKKCSHRAHKKREDNLLSPNDVRKMISKAPLLRDKLAIALLADTGVRAETVGASSNKRSINCGQIKFHKGYAVINDIEEKFDKQRNVIVTEALSYLLKYWNELPEEHRKNPKKPLFIGYSSNKYGIRWGYTGLKLMLHRVSKEALGRTINPHDFRHLKATRLHLDEELSDDAKCKLMGWSSRRMLDRYNHTTFDEAKEEYLIKKGILIKEKGKKKAEAAILRPRECLVCHHLNSSTDTICEQCSNTLDYESIIKAHTEREKHEQELASFLTPEAFQKLFKTVHKLQKELEAVKKSTQ